MYQIIGIQKDGRRRLVATPTSAGAALADFRSAERRFPRVSVQGLDGEEIDGFELNRRALGEITTDRT